MTVFGWWALISFFPWRFKSAKICGFLIQNEFFTTCILLGVAIYQFFCHSDFTWNLLGQKNWCFATLCIKQNFIFDPQYLRQPLFILQNRSYCCHVCCWKSTFHEIEKNFMKSLTFYKKAFFFPVKKVFKAFENYNKRTNWGKIYIKMGK